MKRPDDVTEEEFELAQELQSRLKENGHDIDFSDHPVFDVYTLPRFLRARACDIDAAYELFTGHLEWREENDVDNIVDTCPKTNKSFELLDEYWPGRDMGVDQNGIPVTVFRGGQVDAVGLMKYVPMDDIINYQIFSSERGNRQKKALSAERGKDCYKGIVIQDMDGFGRQHVNSATIDYFKKVNAFIADNYPESLLKCYVVNCPMYVSVAWKLVKGFVDPDTRQKIDILGSGYDPLREFIDEDQIAKAYGGGLDKPLVGGGIYTGKRANGTTYHPFEEDISAGSTLKIDVVVKKKDVGRTLTYTLTTNNDIQFKVSFEGDERNVVVAPFDVVESHKVKKDDEGALEVEAAGTFRFSFDNTSSWMRGRTVKYDISMSPAAKSEKGKKKSSKGKKSSK